MADLEGGRLHKRTLEIAPISSGRQKANTDTIDHSVGIPNMGSCSPLNKQANRAKTEASTGTSRRAEAAHLSPLPRKTLHPGLQEPASEATPGLSPVSLLSHSRHLGGLRSPSQSTLDSDTGALRAPAWSQPQPVLCHRVACEPRTVTVTAPIPSLQPQGPGH